MAVQHRRAFDVARNRRAALPAQLDEQVAERISDRSQPSRKRSNVRRSPSLASSARQRADGAMHWMRPTGAQT